MAPSLTSRPTPPQPPSKHRQRPYSRLSDSSSSPSFYPGGLPPAPPSLRGSSREPGIHMVRTKQRQARPTRPRSVSEDAEQQHRMDLDERAVSGGEERALDDQDDDGSDLSSARDDAADQDEEQDELIEEEVGDGADDTVGPQVMRTKKSGAGAGAPGRRGPRSAARHGEADDGDSPTELGPEDRSKAAAYAEKMRAAAAMGATPSPARKAATLPAGAASSSSSSQPPRFETQRSNSSASQSSMPAQPANGAHQRSNSAADERKPRVSEVPAKAGTPGGVTPPPKDDPRLENALLAPKPSGHKSFPPPTEGGNLLPQEGA